MIFVFENFAESRLEAAAAAGDTVLRVPASDATKFPSGMGVETRFTLVLYDGIQEPEIVWCSANPLTGFLTVERGAEASGAKAWSAGTALINAPTKVSLSYLSSGGSDSWHDELLNMINEAYARIVAERDLRIDADGALASQIETLGVGVGQYAGMVEVLQQAFADIDSAWAQYQIEVTAKANDAVAKATQSLNTSVTNGTAIATLRTDLETAVGDNFAAFAERIEAFTDFDEAQVVINTTIEARVGTTETSLEEEITLRTTQYLSQVDINLDIETRVGDNTAGLSEEITVRSTADAALSTRATNLEAEVVGARNGSATLNARINTVESAAATANSATAGRVTTLEGQVNTPTTGIIARLTTEETVRASADTAQVGRLTTLESQVNTPTTGILARITTEETTRAAADVALASRATTLEGQVNTAGTGILARLTTEETVRATADVAQATRSTTIEARAASLTGTVFPETIGQDWLTRAVTGSPETALAPLAGEIANGAWTAPSGEGRIGLYRGVIPWVQGKVYEVEVEIEIVSGTGGDFRGYTYARCYSSGFTIVGAEYADIQYLTLGSRTTIKRRYGMGVLPPGGTQIAFAVGMAFVRFGSLFNYGTSPNRVSKLHRMSVKEVTGVQAVEARITTEETTRASADGALAARSTVLEARNNSANLLRKSQFYDASFAPWTKDSSVGGTSAYIHPNPANGPGGGELPMVFVIPTGAGYMQWLSELIPAEPGRWVGAHRVFVGGGVTAIQTFLVARDVNGTYLNESPPGPAVNGTGIGALGNWGSAHAFYDAPVGTAYIQLVMRATTNGAYSELWTLRPIVARAVALQTEPPAWTPGAIEGRLTVSEKVAIDAATQLSTVSFDVIAAAGGDPAQLKIMADSSGSLVQLIASALRFSNTIAGTVVDVMKLISGVVYISGKLVMGTLAQIELDPSIPAIIWKIGTAKLFIGQAPFDNLVFWFGPDMAVSAMRKNNATFWMDSAGSAYFGGSLNAGVLYSSGTYNIPTRVPGAESKGVLTHFNSNGGVKTVVSTFTYTQERQEIYSSESSANSAAAAWLAGSNPGSITYSLLRGATVLNSWPVNRVLTAFVSSDGPGAYTLSYGYLYSASNTLTDTFTGTGDIVYTAEISSYSGGAITTGVGGTNSESGQFVLTVAED